MACSYSRFVVLLLVVVAAQPAAGGSDLLTSRPRPDQPVLNPLKVGEVGADKGEPQRLRLPDGSQLFLNSHTRIKLLNDNVLSLESGEVYLDLKAPAGKAEKPWRVRTAKREVTAAAAGFAVRVEDAGASVLVTRGTVEVAGAKQLVRTGQQLPVDKETPEAAPRASHRLAWTRDLMSADVALIPASEYAGGSLVATDPDGQSAKLQLRKFHIDVFIEDGFARTTIDQTYFNQTDDRLEGTFYFPLPPEASLSQLTMYVNGERMDGGMVERDFGRTVYESIVTRQKDPALLEWLDGSTFKMRIFPLEPRQEKRLLLTYTQKLSSLYGQMQYRFPSGHGLDAVRDWSFQARIKHGADMRWDCASHPLAAAEDQGDLILKAAEKNTKANRDVALTLAPKDAARGGEPRFSTVEQDGARYLMLRYRPGLPSQQERERRDWIFLVESSADRDPLLMRTQIEIVRGLLATADPADRFTVLAVNNRTYVFGDHTEPDTLDSASAAMAFLEGVHLIGAFDLGQGLAKAEPYLTKAKNPYLVHIGSGVAAMGERGPGLLQRLPSNARYVGIGVGHRWDRSFMKNAADKTGGYFTQINPDEPLNWRTFELAATLNTPRLLDIGVRAGADGPPWLTTATTLAQGEELCAVVRLTGEEKLPVNVTVRGVLNGKPFEQTLPAKDAAANAGYLPRTWAKLEIDRLLAEDPAKHKDTIVALSKAMYVVTPFTSLLVLENEEMYQQYKVERNRRDRWALYACPEKIPVVYEPVDGQPGDPAKGIKPAATVVAKTIVVRDTPQLLRGQERDELSGMSGAPVGALPIRMQRRGFGGGGFGGGGTADVQEQVQDLPVPTQYRKLVSERERLEVAKSRKSLDQIITRKSSIHGTTTNATGFAETAITYGQPTLSKIASGSGVATYGLWDGASIMTESFVMQTSGGEEEKKGWRYTRPRYSGEANFFADLVAFAPGLNTTRADIRAVLETEAALSTTKAGTIDDGARTLFEKARLAGAHTLTIPADGLQPVYTIHFDDAGRFDCERTLDSGLRELVICDGKTLLHLYPDLGLAARRAVSRFHRLEFAHLVPQALPSPEDYARGADLRVAGERTVAMVPHDAVDRCDQDGKSVPYVEVHLVFSVKGPLAERRYLEMPSKKVIAVEQFGADGSVKYLDADGKETALRKSELGAAKTAPLKVDLKQFIVLPLPYRAPEHILKTLDIEKKGYGDLTFDEGRALLAAFVAVGDYKEAARLFQACFYLRAQRQLGYYVLLAACGNSLDSDHFDLLGEHPNEPLAQYLTLHSSPVLRKHATQWAIASNPWGDGWLNRLATAHALYQRWEGARSARRSDTQQQAELERALEYVKHNKGTALAFALLGLVQDRLAADDDGKKDQRAAWKALAEAWLLFAEQPVFAYHARYENARCLWRAGAADVARKQFRTLYEETFARKTLPPFDADFRLALLGSGTQANDWKELMQRTARQLLERKDQTGLLMLADHCAQLEDPILAIDLLEQVLANVRTGKEYLPLVQAVIEVLLNNGQLELADQKVQALLRDKAVEQQPAMHRLALRIAKMRDQPARQLRHLERALDLEFQNLPEEMNLSDIRGDYSTLLSEYQKQAEVLETLSSDPPRDFKIRVVRAADRWRALDPQATEPCELAARILRIRDDRDLAWDYLTTPLAFHPNEAEPWQDLAATLARQGDLDLADRAYEAAFDAEPTNAQILWDRVQNLRHLGQMQKARTLLKKLADEKWQPRFQWIVQQAKAQLEKR